MHAAGQGNEQERLALLEAHRAEVTARLAEVRENLELIDHKIDVYRGRLAAGDADRLWRPTAQPVTAERRSAAPPDVRRDLFTRLSQGSHVGPSATPDRRSSLSRLDVHLLGGFATRPGECS